VVPSPSDHVPDIDPAGSPTLEQLLHFAGQQIIQNMLIQTDCELQWN
jgi:hypothetical protein